MRQFILSKLRRVLKEIDIRLEQLNSEGHPTQRPGNGREAAVAQFLQSLVLPPDARHYLESHFERLVRTLSLVPVNGRSALELGCYVHPSATLQRVLGYRQVRGAYFSATPSVDHKTIEIKEQPSFDIDIDLFNVESHAFPYADGAFDLVLCTEIIEHLVMDPMHMLFECHRVLQEEGLLLITTPNIASLQSVACALHGWRNPQIYSLYATPGHHETPHVREYTANEIGVAVAAAGFEPVALFTERLPDIDEGSWVMPLLEREGFDTTLRGEQTYCLARRRAHLPQSRYPSWLYAG